MYIKKTTIKLNSLISLCIFICMLIVLLAGCSNLSEDNDRNNINNGEKSDNSILEAYRYVPEVITLENVTDYINDIVVHDGIIYFCNIVESTEGSSKTVIEIIRMQPDGTLLSPVEIPISLVNVSVYALYFTVEGNFAMILTSIETSDVGISFTVFYAEYTPQGIEIMKRELTDILPQSINSFPIGKAIITSTGDILIFTLESGKTCIYILDDQLSLKGQMEINQGFSVSLARDGRIFVSDIERNIDNNRTVLREIDCSKGGWGEIYLTDLTNIHGMYPATANDPFDLYISDGTNLFGYDLITGKKTLFFNWVETNIEVIYSTHLFLLNDSRFALLTSNRDNATNLWRTEYAILTRSERTDVADIEIITIGGVGIGNSINNRDIHMYVNAFNRTNETYQIQIIDYMDGYQDEEYEMAQLRFIVEVMAGNVPDIIYGLDPIYDAMMERGLLTDLYPFIDSDPVLSRADFFPNVLKALEAPDGSLLNISDFFYIRTMISMPDIVKDVHSWTFEEMLSVIDRTDNTVVPLILFEWTNAERFLEMALQFSGNQFIDWEENKAHLDSVEFINLLEIASRLPVELPPWESGYADSTTRMLRGEQLFAIVDILNINDYQFYYGALEGEMVALGLPTPDGGAHVIHTSGFSISANSKNKDAAWSFIRSALMPDKDLTEFWLFPTRIDLFEKLVEAVKIPYFKTDKDGNEVESPISITGRGDMMVEIYSLKDAEELGLRAIVESASILSHNNETINNIIWEEIPRFLAGNRSAGETARVLQNRVQTYLSERR